MNYPSRCMSFLAKLKAEADITQNPNLVIALLYIIMYIAYPKKFTMVKLHYLNN